MYIGFEGPYSPYVLHDYIIGGHMLDSPAGLACCYTDLKDSYFHITIHTRSVSSLLMQLCQLPVCCHPIWLGYWSQRVHQVQIQASSSSMLKGLPFPPWLLRASRLIGINPFYIQLDSSYSLTLSSNSIGARSFFLTTEQPLYEPF